VEKTRAVLLNEYYCYYKSASANNGFLYTDVYTLVTIRNSRIAYSALVVVD